MNQESEPGAASGPECGDQTGVDDARLSASARPDDRQESVERVRAAKSGEHSFDQTLPPEELRGVSLVEGHQTLVRV